MTKKEVPPATERVTRLFGKSYRMVSDNLTLFIIIYSVSALFALWSFLNWFTNDKVTWMDEKFDLGNWFAGFSGLNVSTPAGVGLGLALLLAVAAVVFGLLQVILTFRLAGDRKTELGDVWQDLTKKGFKLFLLEMVMGVLTIIGFILLIVPGVILLWRLFLAPYILLDKGVGVEESLRRSWNMTRGFAWPIYSVMLFGLLLGLSGIVPYLGPIVSFVLAVAYSCVPALRYFEIKKLSS